MDELNQMKAKPDKSRFFRKQIPELSQTKEDEKSILRLKLI